MSQPPLGERCKDSGVDRSIVPHDLNRISSSKTYGLIISVSEYLIVGVSIMIKLILKIFVRRTSGLRLVS